VLLNISVIGPFLHPTGLFLACIVAAAWFGGPGPGFLAALLATLVLPLLIAVQYALIAGFFDLPRFLAFGITGVAVGWATASRRRAEAAVRRSELELRKARNELEMKVLEQTVELRRSEALLAEAQKLSQTGSFGWKVSTGEVLWSEETFRIYGYDPTTKPTVELIRQRVHPEDVALLKERIERASREGKDFELEYRLLMPDGFVKYVHVVAHAVSDASGSIEFVGAVMDVTARKQAEKALRESEEQWKAVFEHNPTMYFMVDTGGTVVSVNQFGAEQLGYTVDELIGDSVLKVFYKPDRESAKEKVALCLKQSGRSLSWELRKIRKDGTMLWVRETARAVHSANGPIVLVACEDITERKRAEEALRRSEAYLADAQSLTHTGSWVGEVSSREFTHWSEGCFRLYGFDSKGGLPSWDEWNERVHPDDRQTRHERLDQAVRQGTDFELDYRLLLPDATIRHMQSVAHPIFNSAGELVEFLGTAMDITERKHVEERLLVQHTVTQILAEAASIEEATPKILGAIGERLGWDVGELWRVDRQASVLRCVEVWHKRSVQVPEFESASRERTFLPGTGLPGSVWLSREPTYLPNSVNDANFPRAPIAAREGLHAAFGFPILLGGEVLGVMEFFSHEIRQPDQELLNMVATIGSQIGQFTERKRAENALRHAQMELAHVTRVATLGEMTASIAHEINQPLAAVVNNASACLRWLAAPIPNLDEAREAVARIARDGKRASDVITRIRALVRKTGEEKARLDINDIIQEVAALAQGELRNNRVALRMELAADLPPVLGDRVQLQQVILNLVMNGIEAMSGVTDRSRELFIRSRQHEPDKVLVAVQDTGMGIDRENVEKIFNAFYTTKSQGMGLGLAISRSIVENQGGELWVVPNDGPGATFQFTLPTGGGNQDD